MTTREILQGVHDWTEGKIVYDISVAHPNGQGNPTPYADLTAALGTGGENIPEGLRKGGMSVKFIQGTAQGSDNKYVQYRLMANVWSTNVNHWTINSDFLFKKQISVSGVSYTNNRIIFGNSGLIFVQEPIGGRVVNINVANTTFEFSSSNTRLVLHSDNTVELVAGASNVLSTDIILLGWSVSLGDFAYGELYTDYVNKIKATIDFVNDLDFNKNISYSHIAYYQGSYINSEGEITPSTSQLRYIKEYAVSKGSFIASGFSPISPNYGVAYYNKDSNGVITFLSGERFYHQHFTNVILNVPKGTNLIRVMGDYETSAELSQNQFPLLQEFDCNSKYPSSSKAIYKKFKKTVKILCIGNSYAFDAMSYVPFILGTVNKDVDVIIGIAKYSSCTLQQHYNFAVNNTATYTYCKYNKSESNAWIGTDNTNDKTLLFCLQDEEWDIVTFQQQSSNARDYSTYQPYLNELIDWVQANVNKAVNLSWLLTPAYPTGYSGLNGDTSNEMFDKIVNASQNVLDETLITDIIPIGTAVQNARKTNLDSLGDFGHLSYDGLHLQEGVPCLLEAYIVIEYILDKCGCEYNLFFGDKTLPTEEWLSDKNIPGKHGLSVGATSENVRIAQQCSIWAIKKPYEIHSFI